MMRMRMIDEDTTTYSQCSSLIHIKNKREEKKKKKKGMKTYEVMSWSGRSDVRSLVSNVKLKPSTTMSDSHLSY